MAERDSSELGIQRRGENLLHSPSSGLHIATTNSACLHESPNGADSIFNSGWDQNRELKGSAMSSRNPISISPYSVGMLGHQRASNNSHLLGYPFVPNHLEISHNLSSFGSGSFSAMVSSFGLPEYDQINNDNCRDFPSTEEIGINSSSRKADGHGPIFRSNIQVSDEGGSASSPDAKKRKRTEIAEPRKGISQEPIEGLKEQDGKKQKTEKNLGANLRGKSSGKLGKDSSQNDESSKEDYIHVRARRGQATNSHSLAERVRREKISQRMKYLQDLVPGCDKITGKALMLDEIINYVQSLQRQVEFLSMKLSTVNPEVNIDIERIMSKDILHSQAGGSTILGFGSGISSSHSQPLISPTQGAVQGIHCPGSHLHPVPQIHPIWDNEFQNIIQMGLISDPALETLGLNGKVGTN